MAIETKKKKSKRLQIRAIGGKPLPDELLKPIARRSQNMLLGDQDAAIKAVLQEQIKRIKALVQFLGFDPDKDGIAAYGWALFDIACEYIPGFQLEREPVRRGRKKEWTIEKYEKLVKHVDDVSEKFPEWNKNASRICAHLLKHNPYKDEWKGIGKKRLENLLGAARQLVHAHMLIERYRRRFRGCFPSRIPVRKYRPDN